MRIHPEVKRLRSEAEKKRLRHRKRRFLKKLSDCGQILQACELAGVGRCQVRRWRNNPVFEERVLSAKQVAIERLKAEAVRRGYTGVSESCRSLLIPLRPWSGFT